MATLNDYYKASLDWNVGEDEPAWGAAMNSGYTAGDTYTGGEYAQGSQPQPKPAAKTPDYTIHNANYSGPSVNVNDPNLNKNWAPLWSNVKGGGGGASPAKTTSAGAAAAKDTAIGTVSTSRTEYTGTAPTFAAPEYDEREVRKRSQKLAAPALRKLEMGVTQALGKYYENPNVRSMVVRDALAGYGMGLGSALMQAEQTATQQYGAEHARHYNAAMQSYNVAMQKYMQSARQVSTTQKVYSSDDMETVQAGGSGGVVPTEKKVISRVDAALGRY